MRTKKQSAGFALLMSLIVVSVVISVALTLLELTIKQVKLAAGTKDSESAFHAANAGVECVRYWRLASSTEFENGTGDTVPMQCFDAAVNQPVRDSSAPFDGATDDIYKYTMEFSWGGTTPTRCSKMTMITLSSDPTSTGVTLNNVANYLTGYRGPTDKTCAPGGRCSIISVQGFNQPCTTVSAGSIGIVQREVLLEL